MSRPLSPWVKLTPLKISAAGPWVASLSLHTYGADLAQISAVPRAHAHPQPCLGNITRNRWNTYRLRLCFSVQGASPAGGCLIALTCDYRIMADNPKYTIGLNETLLGIVAPFW